MGPAAVVVAGEEPRYDYVIYEQVWNITKRSEGNSNTPRALTQVPPSTKGDVRRTDPARPRALNKMHPV